MLLKYSQSLTAICLGLSLLWALFACTQTVEAEQQGSSSQTNLASSSSEKSQVSSSSLTQDSKDSLRGVQINSDASIETLWKNQTSDVQVLVQGKVQRLLSDDTDGSQHQRWIIELQSGHTLLIAHNIDLAPRVEGLTINSPIAIYGEYVWNAEGGLIHWTHRDPESKHIHGWIDYLNKLYQ